MPLRTRDNYQVRGRTIEELVTAVNFLLQRFADRMDKIEGIRGTASIESDLDMNSNVITEVGGGTLSDDAARLSDIDEVSAFTVTAGSGLTGGGVISSNPTLDVGAGTGISVTADAVSIAADGVTNTLLADMAASTVKGRAAGGGSGDPQDLTATQVKAILALTSGDLSDFTEAAQDAAGAALTDTSTIDFTYDDAANQIKADVKDTSVTYAKIQNVSATSRALGRITAGAGSVEELTGANLATIIGTSLGANPSVTIGLSATNGSAGTYLRSDAAPALNVGITPTWSGLHLFSAALKVTGSATFTGEGIELEYTGGAGYVTAFNRSGATWKPITLRGLDVHVDPQGGGLGFFGATAITKPSVSGSRGGNAALASLLTALANYGLITDGSSA